MEKRTILLSFLASCFLVAKAEQKVVITVSNTLAYSRTEVVEADLAMVKQKLKAQGDVVVTDAQGKEIASQQTHDGKLIFQANVDAKGKTIYYATVGTPQKYAVKATGRLFTERQDEFGWENDCVAYRIYGHGGAVGYDLFNKNTDEMMLDYWYASEQNKEMRSVSKQLRDRGYRDLADQVYNAFCYHIDHGKGMDCYTVGPTLGGGANALMNVDGSLAMPQCYKSYKILDQGPLRFTVELTYPEREFNGQKLTERRVVTLDAGSYFNHVAVTYSGLEKPITIVAGTVVHKSNPDAYVMSATEGYVGYEDLGDGSVYNAKYRTELEKQMGKIYIGLLFPDKKVATSFQPREVGIATGHVVGKSVCRPDTPYIYYFGSGWNKNQKAGFASFDDWTQFLAKQAKAVRTPMKVAVK